MADAKAFGVAGTALTRQQRLAMLVASAGGPTKAAETLNISRGTLHNWMTKEDARVPFDVVDVLARAAGVSLEWVATGRESRSDALARGMSVLYRYEIGRAGEMIEIADHGTDVAFRNEFLATLGIPHPERAALLSVTGDAMAPTVPQGSLLVIDRGAASITDPGIYALVTSAGVAVRRAQPMLDGGLKLIADNPRCEPETIPAAAVKALKVAGRVRAAIVTL